MRIEVCIAFSVSIVLHASLFAFMPGDGAPVPETPAALVIRASLKNTLEDAPHAAENRFDSPAKSASIRPGSDRRREARLEDPRRFYPPQAVAQGLQGEAVVMLRIDRAGALIDAQIAKSSGYAILDQAALRAVRATPRFAPGPREMLFPVTFALH